MGVRPPVGCTVLMLLVALGPAERYEECTVLHIQSSVFTQCILFRHCAASVPVVTVLDGVMDRALLVGGGEAMLVGIWSCVAVLVEEVGRAPLVGGGEAMLVGIWSCVAVVVGIGDGVVDGVPLVVVGSGVAVAVGLPVGSTVLMIIPLDPGKCVKYVSVWGGHFASCRSYCKCCALSLCHYLLLLCW